MPVTPGITPGRKTRVTLNYPLPICISPSYAYQVIDQEISDPQSQQNSNVEFVPGIGWRIKQYQYDLSALHETSVADANVLTNTSSTGILTAPIQRKPTELTGLGLTLIRASGDNFYQKTVGAGLTWAITDSTDQAAYPGPTTTENVLVDRLFISDGNDDPKQQIWFRFFVPGTSGQTPVQEIIKLYFVSIPSDRGEYAKSQEHPATYTITPLGQYCLILQADGNAQLWERREIVNTGVTTYDWAVRYVGIRWTGRQNVSGRWHQIGVFSDARYEDSTWKGKTLQLYFEDTDPDKMTLYGAALDSINYSINGPRLVGPTNTYKFLNKGQQPVEVPVRVDVRRDVRAKFQVSNHLYRSSGTLVTRQINIDHVSFDTTKPLKVTFYGSFPAGTSASITAYCADDGTALTPTSATGIFDQYAARDFSLATTPAKDRTAYYFQIITYADGSGETSPIVNSLLLAKDAKFTTSSPTPTIINNAEAFSVSGQSRDITTETATVIVPDVHGSYSSLLEAKSGIPIKIETYSVVDNVETDFTTIFEGEVSRATKHPIGTKRPPGGTGAGTKDPYESALWGKYEITCVGMWKVLFESQIPRVQDFASDPDDPGQPYKVGVAISNLFDRTGWPYYEVPDYTGAAPGSNRFPLELNIATTLRIEPYTKIGQVITDWARDFLGSYLVWDSNARTSGSNPLGMMRVLLAPTPVAGVYRRLAAFRTTNTTDPGIVVSENRMPDVDDYAGDTCKQFWIQKNSLDSWVTEPEGNAVIVTGSGYVQTLLGAQGGQGTSPNDPTGKLSRTIYNYEAANFGQLAPDHPLPNASHPDYTDGRPRYIYIANKALQSQAAVDLVARRVFDYSCHAKYFKQFSAPLWRITNPDDTYQVRPRPLRFGDMVTLDDVFYVVWGVNITCGKGEGNNQMMSLTLMRAPALDTDQYKAIYSQRY